MAYLFTTGSVSRGDIYYEDDVDKNTYLDWSEDQLDIVVGAKSMIKMVEAATDKITINNGGSDVDLQIKSNNNANLIRTDGGNDRVGIGLSAPTSTFEVSGSHAGNLYSSATSFTLNSTHFMVAITGDTMTGTLPAADECGGRIYHIFNNAGGHEGASIDIDCAGEDTINGQGTLTIDSSEEGGGNSSVSLVSDGDDSWLIFGQYTPQEEGG